MRVLKIANTIEAGHLLTVRWGGQIAGGSFSKSRSFWGGHFQKDVLGGHDVLERTMGVVAIVFFLCGLSRSVFGSGATLTQRCNQVVVYLMW